MSQQYDNKGRFGLWRNRDRKETTHPHLAGQGETLSGRPCWISAWFSKDLTDGDRQVLQDMARRYDGTSTKPFINIVIREKEVRQKKDNASPDKSPQTGHGYVDDNEGDIPF